jgi:hypothetical protein
MRNRSRAVTAYSPSSNSNRRPRFRLFLVAGLAFLAVGGAGPGELLEWVASWPGYGRGPALDVAVAGRYAYVAAGTGGLSVVDVGDPTQPRRVGGYWVPGMTQRVRVDGSRAYVARKVRSGGGCRASERGSFEVLDLSDPVRPKLVGRFATGQEIKDVQVLGQQAYVLEGGRLQVLDLRHPDRLVGLGARAVGSGGFWGNASALYATSDRVCVGADKTLYLADSSLPAPAGWQLTATNLLPVSAVRIQNEHAYVTDRGGLTVFRLNPTLQWVSRLPTPEPLLGFDALGGHVVAAAGETGLVIVDLTDPAAPKRRATCETPGYAVAVTVSGNYAYVADYEGGLQVVDLTDPSRPVRTGSCETGLTTQQARVVGDRVFILTADKHPDAALGRSRIELVSLANTAQPALLGLYEIPNQKDMPSQVTAYEVREQVSYLLGTPSGSSVVDWSNPAQPRWLGSFPLTEEWDYSDITLSGATAFITGYKTLTLFDLAQPTLPRRRGSCTLNGGNLQVRGNHAYLASSQGTIEIVDVSNLDHPVKVGEWSAPAGYYPGMFQIEGDYGYYAGERSLVILDLREPLHLSSLASYVPDASVVSVAGEGQYAFLAEGDAGLEVLDMSDPTRPTRVASWSGGSSANSVQAQGGLVYVADAGLGLVVLRPRSDLVLVAPPQSQRVARGQPASLSVVATGPAPLSYQWYRGESGDVSAPIAGATEPTYTIGALQQDTSLWVRVRSGAGWVDSPTTRLRVGPAVTFQRIGAWPGYRMGEANAIEVAGPYAYVAASTAGLMVLDLSDPAAPRRVGGCETGDSVLDIALFDHYAVLASDRTLWVLDVAQPAQPGVVGSYAVPRQLQEVVLAVAGQHACLLETWADRNGWRHAGLEVVDLVDPTNPKALGEYAIVFPCEPDPNCQGYAWGLAVAGSRAYVTEFWYEGGPVTVSGGRFEVLDLSDPANPRLIGSSMLPMTGDLSGVAVAGSYAYVANGWHDEQAGRYRSKVLLIDISNPAKPMPVVGMGSLYDTKLWVEGAYLKGHYLFVAGAYLEVFDVSNPMQPRHLGSGDLGASLRDIALAGAHAYAASGGEGLVVVDVSDPAQPKRLGGFDTLQTPEGMPVKPPYVLQGTYGYSTADGLEILDVSDSSQPRRIGGYHNDEAKAVAALGNYACLAAGGDGVLVYDVTTPAAPVWIGVHHPWGQANDVFMTNHLAFVAVGTIQGYINGQPGDGGFEVLDLTDPARPVGLARLLNGTSLDRLCVVGQYVYASSGTGLYAVDVSNPAQPFLAGHYDAPETSDVGLDQDRLYLAQGTYGLTILRPTPALWLDQPVIIGDRVRLSWTGSPGVRLQRTARLNPAQWTDVPVSEGASQIDLPCDSAKAFFRLSQP